MSGNLTLNGLISATGGDGGTPVVGLNGGPFGTGGGGAGGGRIKLFGCIASIGQGFSTDVSGGDVGTDFASTKATVGAAGSDFDGTTGPCVTEVDIDIKPTSCPNPLNVNSKGNLPVAILGTDELDVNDIDVATVQLEGVAPIRSAIEDVTTPIANRQDDCDCTADGPDGFDDLTLKFDTQAIVTALGGVNDGDEVKLTVTGNLNDGTAITGLDCVIIKKKGK